MGQRTRRKRRGVTAPAPAPAPARPAPPQEPAARDRMEAGYARGRERDEAIRAALAPLPPGERTTSLNVAVAAAILLAVLVIAGAATNDDLSASGGSWIGAALIAGVLLLAAFGMFRTRYWAVIGFEAFLAFQIIMATIALVVVSNWWGLLVCVAVIVLSGWLAWKLIRVMARIQAYDRGPRTGGREGIS
ncbi:hypothetical protein [Capillimicrobium parvum]|uniref:Uncharacterized protein n=1 Tax=Capillimicrobium parvum TaxID=2884022 RepID=A0A9E6XTT5_9ACTN|nr:hypothetical protein [Capillimicrobium parvum]UGS33938.1 hypothetical protein DSM104329_00305 [Capillimicrobium parvum]